MYSLFGFIHVLLMLTQSRFMPDLGMLLKEQVTTVGSGSQPLSHPTFGLPVETAPRLSFATVRSSDKDKLKQLLQKEARAFREIQKPKKRNRIIIGSKLYILLGQLKTEG